MKLQPENNKDDQRQLPVKSPREIEREMREAITTEDSPRAWTEEEVRDQILDHMRALAKYWADTDHPTVDSVEDRIRGALFSTLSMLDGCTMNLPAFDLKVAAHPDDKQYHIDEGTNYYEPDMVISFPLHEFWHQREEASHG